ncbi:unnamed protein product [Coregonus sp. 'balchen']|nr:unnamed protein product [Coregonus sp. 'balchen']
MSAMEVPGPESDWRSPAFRQKVVAQIEEAMRKAGTAHTKSSNEMENHVYVKAKSRIKRHKEVWGFQGALSWGLGHLVRPWVAWGPWGRCKWVSMQWQVWLEILKRHVPISSLSQQQQQLKIQALQMMMPRPGMQIPPRLPRAAPNPAIPPNSAAMGGQQMPQVQQHQMMSSPSPVQVQTPQSMPPPPQPQPSPQPPSSQPNSVSSSGPTPSPGSFQPSPSPQPSHSPATARTPQNYSVPSPGPLNTPGNPSSVMSPSGANQLEDQQYMEKLKQLSKYIEPLRRMINKIDKNEDRKKDLSKMKSLLNILTDPNTRCPLRTLQKCEIALEKLKNDMAVPTPPPPPVPCTKQQYLCQPLLDAVMANIRSPVFNHSLYRTFAPAMTAIHGPPITGPIIAARKRKHEEDERQTIPNILQGEVARLNAKFLVNLDPSFCNDKNLPSVPPLQLSIPADYPDQSPQCQPLPTKRSQKHDLQAPTAPRQALSDCTAQYLGPECQTSLSFCSIDKRLTSPVHQTSAGYNTIYHQDCKLEGVGYLSLEHQLSPTTRVCC